MTIVTSKKSVLVTITENLLTHLHGHENLLVTIVDPFGQSRKFAHDYW